MDETAASSSSASISPPTTFPPSSSTPQTPPPPTSTRSSQALVSMYANRPLPPLPPEASSPSAHVPTTAVRRRRATTSESDAATANNGRTASVILRDRLSRTESMCRPLPPLPPVFPASSPKTRHGQSSSFGPSIRASSRRSSSKIHQLIGHDVDVMDAHLFHSAGAGHSDSSSSTGSTFRRSEDAEMPESYGVPVLDADSNGSSSRGSSWGPMSPSSSAIPAPLNIHKPVLDETDKRDTTSSPPFPYLRLDDDLFRPWHPGYGHFSDVGAAGEYHRFTANLASRHSRQVSDDSIFLAVPEANDKKRLSLGFPRSAASRFGGRRGDHLGPIETARSSPMFEQQRPSSAKSFFPPSTRSAPVTPMVSSNLVSPEPGLVSAWDSDSDDEEEHNVLATVKGWFAHKTSDEAKGHRRAVSDGRVNSSRQSGWQQREAQFRFQDRTKEVQAKNAATYSQHQHRNQDRAKDVNAKAAAKKKAEFDKYFSVIPEERLSKPPRLL